MSHPSAHDRDGLDRLTPGEREVLILLARGHTAKTIATSLDLSVAAVNERLRGARRRTGAGSSRELARRLAQQNRDEFSGLAASEGSASGSGTPAPTGRWVTRRHVMIASTTLAAVLALTLAPGLMDARQTAPDQAGPDDAVIARFSEAPNPRQLRDRLRTEQRDEGWATRTESGIRERYGRLPATIRSLETLSVACGATLCEVMGWTRSGATGDDVATVMTEVQSGDLNAAIEQLGLRTSSSSFTARTGRSDGMVFVAYLERATGA